MCRVCFVALILAGCSGAEPAAEPARPPKKDAAPKHQIPAADAAEDADEAPAKPAKPDTSTPEERADLETLCAAVHHDYVDGTLSDYFAGIEAKTEWGKKLLAEGDASTTPGRVLEKAATTRGIDPTVANLESCTALFDDLEDLE